MTARVSSARILRRRGRASALAGALLPWVLGAAAAALALLLAAIAIVLLRGAWLAFGQSEGFRLSSPLMGTAAAAALGSLIAFPLSFGVASFVTEFALTPLSRLVSFALDVAAVLPTVVFGLWGLFVLAPILSGPGGSPSGQGLVAASLVLAGMLAPFLAALMRDLFASVPAHQREAAVAVGATRWEVMTKLVLPQVRFGLLGALALGLARAGGETVAVMLVIGHPPAEALSLFGPATTAATTIAAGLSPDTSAPQTSALVALAGYLFVMTAVALVLAHALARRAPRGGGDA